MRDFSTLKHKKVDDTSFGGDFGLVIRSDIVHDALTHAMTLHKNPLIVCLSPKGDVLTQEHVKRFMNSGPSTQDDNIEVIFLCGRYEGIDERVIEYWKENHGLLEISLGDFILSGGEIGALTIMDTLLRYQTVERQETLQSESFESGLLEYPHYTKPREWKGMQVPDVLLSGHHKDIEKWKQEMSEKITERRRPDLWRIYSLKSE